MKWIRKENQMVICYTFLFLVDLVVVIRDYLPISVSKVLLYLICFFMLAKMAKRTNIVNCGQTKSFWEITTLYFVLLFLRLLCDFVFPWKGFFLYHSPLTVLFFYFMTMVMPCYFLRRIYQGLNYTRFCLCSGICLCFYLLFSYRDIMSGMVVAVTTGGQFEGIGGIDIISYGHFGLSLIIIAVYLLLYSGKKFMPVSVIFLFAGFSAMVLSGARSPFIGLFLCVLVLLKSKYSKWYYMIGLMVILLLMGHVFQAEIIHFNEYLKSMGIGSFERVVNTFINDGGQSIDEVSSGRDDIYAVSWNYFLSNPIVGFAYLLPDNSYVHNIFIEQFMGLGLIGGVLFIVINIKVIVWGWKTMAVSPTSVLTYTLFLQYLILGCFSRTIIALGAYWLFMFTTVINYERIKKQSIGYHSNL